MSQPTLPGYLRDGDISQNNSVYYQWMGPLHDESSTTAAGLTGIDAAHNTTEG